MAAWEFLQREQMLVADQRYSLDFYREAYTWMVRQMECRIKANSEAWPLWAWYQTYGIDRRRPDLRRRAHLPRGERGVRIEFDQPDSGVLLSDFDLWALCPQLLVPTPKPWPLAMHLRPSCVNTTSSAREC